MGLQGGLTRENIARAMPVDPPPDGSPLRACALRVIPSPEKDTDH